MTDSHISILKQKKIIFPFLSVILAMLVGALIFIIPPPLSTQLYETFPEQYLDIDVVPGIIVELDADSSITVKNSEPPRVELLRGSAYFNVKHPDLDRTHLEIIVGDVVIKDMGASFSLHRQNDKFRAAVATRRIEVKTNTQTRFVEAGMQIDFDNTRILDEATISSTKIAPWRKTDSRVD